MRRVLSSGVQKAAYTSSARALAEPAAAGGAQLIINFNTPHAPVLNKKAVEQVVLPGAAGVYAVTHGHSPIISQLEPGVVSVYHIGVSVKRMKRFFCVFSMQRREQFSLYLLTFGGHSVLGILFGSF